MGFTRTLPLLLGIGLIVYSVACGKKRSSSVGFLVDVASAPTSCGDGRNIVAIAMGNGKARLNSEPAVWLDQLVLRLREVLKYRAEKLVYVTAEPQTSWADFLVMTSRVWPEAGVISLVTSDVERLARQRHCLATSCWPCDELRSRRVK